MVKKALMHKKLHPMKLILKSELKSVYKIKAINGYVVTLLTYTFGILQWSRIDMKSIDRKGINDIKYLFDRVVLVGVGKFATGRNCVSGRMGICSSVFST